MEREEGRGGVTGEEREREREKGQGREDSTEEGRGERLQPLQRHNHPVHQVLPWASALGLLSQQPFLEQAIACGLKAFNPRLLEVGPGFSPPAKDPPGTAQVGRRRRFPFVLGFHHFSLLRALSNLSLNYCLLSLLVANMYLFTVHFDFSRFSPFSFFLSVLLF